MNWTDKKFERFQKRDTIIMTILFGLTGTVLFVAFVSLCIFAYYVHSSGILTDPKKLKELNRQYCDESGIGMSTDYCRNYYLQKLAEKENVAPVIVYGQK